MKRNIQKYMRLLLLFAFIYACNAGGLNDKTKELSGGYIARIDGNMSYILPDNIFKEGIYPNVIDFAFNDDFILVYQIPSKELFVTFLADDILTRFTVLANVQDTLELRKEEYELMKTGFIADSSFYRMLSRELSPNNTVEDMKKCEEIAKNIIINSDYYKTILEQDTCLWIISHVDKRKYGPLTRKEFSDKAKELNIPEELQLEFKGYIE